MIIVEKDEKIQTLKGDLAEMQKWGTGHRDYGIAVFDENEKLEKELKELQVKMEEHESARKAASLELKELQAKRMASSGSAASGSAASGMASSGSAASGSAASGSADSGAALKQKDFNYLMDEIALLKKANVRLQAENDDLKKKPRLGLALLKPKQAEKK